MVQKGNHRAKFHNDRSNHRYGNLSIAGIIFYQPSWIVVNVFQSFIKSIWWSFIAVQNLADIDVLV